MTQSQTIYNLVNNGSFEVSNKCSANADNINDASFWFKCTIPGSPDYFQACGTNTDVTSPLNSLGFQVARDGTKYAGFFSYTTFIPDAREYISTSLKNLMSTGKKYCVTYYVSLAELSRYASANIGILFTNDSIRNYTPIWPPYTLVNTPVFENSSIIFDTINWTQIQTQYSANGTEKFILLGNFRTDLFTNKQLVQTFNPVQNYFSSYYYIDDISVVEINPANASTKDTLISRCVNDSVLLGTDSTEFATYTWQSTAAGLAGLSCTNCPNPIAKPQITTKYYLTKVQCSSTTMDSVLVVVKTPTSQASAGINQLICEGDGVQIGAADSTSYTNYTWFPNTGLSCSNCATPYANPVQTTIYNLQRQECNVITSSSVKITIDDCNPTYTVPNVFTPNYDGVNDTWGVMFSSSKYIKNFQLQIYNRWGILVYTTNSEISTPNIRWDGHTNAGIECSSGVYYYVITFNKNEEAIQLKGYVSLFR